MTSCSLYASGLVPDVNGAVPTFSYRRDGHSNDYFGVQMTYLRGQSTCYQTGVKPSFTPVVQNTAARFSANCEFGIQPSGYTGIFCPAVPVTNIPDGVFTVSYINLAQGLPTPIPFLATFGPSPAPRAVTATAGAVTTSTSTSTSTVAPGFASTATVFAAASTQTFTNTIIVTQTKTNTNTNYVSSCAVASSATSSARSSSSSSTSPSSSSARPSSSTSASSSTPSALPTPSGISNSCPADNGKFVYTSAGTFEIACSYDRGGSTSGPFQPGNGLLGCINLCADTKECIWSTYHSSDKDCYLKFGQGTPKFDSTAWGAALLGASSSSTPVPSTSTAIKTSASSQAPPSSTAASSTVKPSSSSVPAPAPSSSSPSSSSAKPSSSFTPVQAPSSSSAAVSSTPIMSRSSTSSQSSSSSATTLPKPAASSSAATSSSTAASPSPASSSSPGTTSKPAVSSSMAFSSSAAASSSQDASSGAASSASTIAASTKASSSSAASPTLTDSADTRPTCPGDNGKTFTTAAGTFVIECYVDRFNNDLGPASSNPTDYAGCLNACAATSGCKAVSYVPNGACYLKNGIGAPSTNIGIWGASLVSGASSTGPGAASMASSAATSSASTSTLASTTSTGPVATSSVVCPGSDGQTISTQAGTFVVECGIDRAGGDMANSPVYPGSYVGCVAACASRDSCVDVSYVQNGPCYLKSIAGTPNPNANIIGGRLITVTSSSSSVASSSGKTSSPTRVSTSSGASVTSRASLSVAATSLAATSGPAAPVQTVTVTTTISGTGYQCACTPSGGLGSGTASSATASATSGAQLNCPASDGSIFTSSCGATYRIECYSDRYGDDIPGGTSYTNTLDECIADCDKTNGCVDVSYIRGSPGPCYKKSSVAAIQRNDNVFGALQLTGCTSSIKLKLHRKRVVRSPTTPKKIIHKRGVFGPDFTYTQGTTTVTQTTTSTSVHNTTVTRTPTNVGTTTKTVFTTASTTATVTNGATITQTTQTTVTTCPAVTSRTIL